MNKSFNKITVEKIEANPFKTGVEQATLRQVVTVAYPSIKIANSLNDSLFSEDDLGIEEQTFEENRVSWRDVPVGASVEAVQKQLDSFPNARLYKILSSEPILTDSDLSAIEAELTTKETIAEKQRVQDGEGNHVDFNSKAQYRRIAFSLEGKEDIDMRDKTMVVSQVRANVIKNNNKVIKKTTVKEARTV